MAKLKVPRHGKDIYALIVSKAFVLESYTERAT